MGLELTAMLYTSRILPLIRVLNLLTRTKCTNKWSKRLWQCFLPDFARLPCLHCKTVVNRHLRLSLRLVHTFCWMQ